MPITRRHFLAAGLGAGAFALFGGRAGGQTPHRERWYVFGTLLDISIAGAGGEALKPVLASLSTDLQRMNRDWHPWQPGVMGNINQALAAGRSIAVDEDMRNMLTGVKQLHHASGGAFNPAIGHIVAQWGFHAVAQRDWRPPANEHIEEFLAHPPSPADLELKQNELHSRNPMVKLDLGGYAKGYALNQSMQRLRVAGVQHAVLNAGGDLLAMGRQGKRPWRIGIRHPQRRGSIAWLETDGSEAVFTSGNYERYREYQGIRYPHIINPANGRPSNEVASATVVHPDAALADAAATALSVAGKKHWADTAAAMGVHTAMVVDEQGRVEMTRDMRGRVRMAG